MQFFEVIFWSIFDRILCDFGGFFGSKLEPCWVLYTIQEAKQNQIPKIATISTAPRRERHFEGSGVFKMAPKSTTSPSEMHTNIDQKSDHFELIEPFGPIIIEHFFVSRPVHFFSGAWTPCSRYATESW